MSKASSGYVTRNRKVHAAATNDPRVFNKLKERRVLVEVYSYHSRKVIKEKTWNSISLSGFKNNQRREYNLTISTRNAVIPSAGFASLLITKN